MTKPQLKRFFMNINKIKNDDFGIIFQYNLKIKYYNKMYKKYEYSSFDKIKGFSKHIRHNGSSTIEELEELKKYQLSIRKNKISDLALNNKDRFQYFITLTFDDNLVNSYSHENVQKKLKNWIDTQRRNNPNMYYILVPELHKSGRIHFHGIVGNVPNWKLKQAINPNTGKEIIKDGARIYNLTNYKLGFTTVSKIKDSEKVCNYITKYITKELLNLKNKKNYWFSRNLEYPKEEYYYCTEEELFDIINKEEVRFAKEKEKTNSKNLYYITQYNI